MSNGESASQRGQWAEAVEEFEAALKLDPEHPVHRTKYLLQICQANVKVNIHWTTNQIVLFFFPCSACFLLFHCDSSNNFVTFLFSYTRYS